MMGLGWPKTTLRWRRVGASADAKRRRDTAVDERSLMATDTQSGPFIDAVLTERRHRGKRWSRRLVTDCVQPATKFKHVWTGFLLMAGACFFHSSL